MHNYESLFILNPELDETAMDNLIDFIQKSMEKSGKVKEVNRWGLKDWLIPSKNMITDSMFCLSMSQSQRLSPNLKKNGRSKMA